MAEKRLPSTRLCFTTLTVTIFLVVPAAYQNTVINQPQELLMAFINQSIEDQFQTELDGVELNAVWGVLVSASGFAAIPSALCLPSLTRHFGVQNLLLIGASICNILCPVLECLARYSCAFELFVIGQVVGPGIGWTIAFGLAPIYLAEISPVELRGMTGSYVSFGFYTGIALSFALGPQAVLGSEQLWGFYVLLSVGPAFMAVLCFPFMTGYPRHDVVASEAIVLRRNTDPLGSGGSPEAQLRTFAIKRLWRERHMRQAVILSVVSQIFVFCCGPMVIMSYATSIFSSFLPLHTAQLATVTMAAPLPFISLAASFVVERFNRRTLLIGGGFAMIASLLVFLVCREISSYFGATWLLYLAASGIVLNVWISPIGPLSVGMFLMSELTPTEAQTSVSAICVIFSMLTYISLNFAFPTLDATIAYWAVLVLLIIPSVCCLTFLYLKMPETRGKSTDEITRMLFNVPTKRTAQLVTKQGAILPIFFIAGQRVVPQRELARIRQDLCIMPELAWLDSLENSSDRCK